MPFSLAEIVVPFAAPYRPLWVGVGQVGLYLTAIVYASFHLRRQIGQRAWRLIHYLTFLSFLGATAHGILSGTDTGTAWAWWSYVAASALVVFLTAYRVVISVEARRAASALPVAAPAPRPAPHHLPAPRPGTRPRGGPPAPWARPPASPRAGGAPRSDRTPVHRSLDRERPIGHEADLVCTNRCIRLP